MLEAILVRVKAIIADGSKTLGGKHLLLAEYEDLVSALTERESKAIAQSKVYQILGMIGTFKSKNPLP